MNLQKYEDIILKIINEDVIGEKFTCSISSSNELVFNIAYYSISVYGDNINVYSTFKSTEHDKKLRSLILAEIRKCKIKDILI